MPPNDSGHSTSNRRIQRTPVALAWQDHRVWERGATAWRRWTNWPNASAMPWPCSRALVRPLPTVTTPDGGRGRDLGCRPGGRHRPGRSATARVGRVGAHYHAPSMSPPRSTPSRRWPPTWTSSARGPLPRQPAPQVAAMRLGCRTRPPRRNVGHPARGLSKRGSVSGRRRPPGVRHAASGCAPMAGRFG